MILALIPSDPFDTALARARSSTRSGILPFFFLSPLLRLLLLPPRTFYFMNNVATARGRSSPGPGDASRANHGGHTLRVGRAT